MVKKLQLCIANRCFVKCPGCYHIFPKSKDEVSNKQVINFLDSAIINGLSKVTFAGGDPLTRADIYELIEYCYKQGLTINIDTVGTPLVTSCNTLATKEYVNQITDCSFLSKVDYVGIPLDGSSNEIIQIFRKGRKNFLEEQLAILDLLEEIGANVCINTVLHRGNYNDLLNIFQIISRYTVVKKWQIFEFMPIGTSAFMYRKRYMISDMDSSIIDSILAINTDINIEYKSNLERESTYMLINSVGEAYKVDLNNNLKIYGNITKKESWNHIFTNM